MSRSLNDLAARGRNRINRRYRFHAKRKVRFSSEAEHSFLLRDQRTDLGLEDRKRGAVRGLTAPGHAAYAVERQAAAVTIAGLEVATKKKSRAQCQRPIRGEMGRGPCAPWTRVTSQVLETPGDPRRSMYSPKGVVYRRG